MLIRSLPQIIINQNNLEVIQTYNIYDIFTNQWLERGILRLGEKAQKIKKQITEFCEKIST